MIKTQEKPATIIKLMVYFGIEVIEVIIELITVTAESFSHKSCVRGTSTKRKRSAIFDNRSFQMYFISECTYAQCTMITFHIPVVGTHVYNRRETSAIACRKRTLEQCNLFHSFGCEDREDT